MNIQLPAINGFINGVTLAGPTAVTFTVVAGGRRHPAVVNVNLTATGIPFTTGPFKGVGGGAGGLNGGYGGY
jgi:hypothetical protein